MAKPTQIEVVSNKSTAIQGKAKDTGVCPSSDDTKKKFQSTAGLVAHHLKLMLTP